MMRIILISIMISLFWVGNASAKDIAQCGKSKGYAFYPKYGYASTQKDVGKWIADGISKGRFTISLLDNGKYDVLFVDSNGGITSSVRDSGIVILVGKTKNSLSLMVSYPNISVETYSVYLTVDGKAEMMWTQNKYGATIPKVAAFSSSCDFLSF
jgi:hypothetical protein